MITNEEIHLHRLERYQDFVGNVENAGQRGVYIWGFRFQTPGEADLSAFLPYYVGKHRVDIQARVKQHALDIREGTHRILFRERFREPECWRYFQYKNPNKDDYAYLYVKGVTGPKCTLSRELLDQLQPHIDNYLDNLFVTYVSVNDFPLGEEEKAAIDYLERYIQEKVIGFDRLVSRRGRKFPDTFRPRILAGQGTEHLFETVQAGGNSHA